MSDVGYHLNDDGKFDIQLNQSKIEERRLAEIFVGADIELVEVKAESFLWERSGNLCIEFEWNGEPSGIAKTNAGIWAQTLIRAEDGEVMGWVLFKVDRLKEVCRQAYREGRFRRGVGDKGKSSVVLIRLRDLWPMLLCNNDKKRGNWR
jgi:hypothetical protein